MKTRQWVGVVVVMICVSGLILLMTGHLLPAAPPAVDTTPVSPIVTSPHVAESSDAVSAGPPIKKKSDTSTSRTVSPSEVIVLRIGDILSASFGGAIIPNDENSLVPPTSSEVFRWADRGQPSCPAKDSVFILGHTVRDGGGVFNDLQLVKAGQTVTIRTDSGVIRYEVTSTKLYDKEGITNEDHVYARVPNRLVLIGCYLNPDGSVQDKNFVVTARSIC